MASFFIAECEKLNDSVPSTTLYEPNICTGSTDFPSDYGCQRLGNQAASQNYCSSAKNFQGGKWLLLINFF